VELPSDSLAILGGTFNPPHLGHLMVAQAAFYRFRLSRVVFSPAAQNPLKPAEEEEAAKPDARLAMLRLATEPDGRFSVDAYDLRKGGLSFTINTLKRYRERYPDAELYFLLGADAAATLPQWKDIEQYRELCTLAIYPRADAPDFSRGLPDELAGLRELGLRWEYVPMELWPVSSTLLRRRVREGKPIRYYVPDDVADFIHQHALYK
jgi:nicotinate-nucleotide adenylyltransferase